MISVSDNLRHFNSSAQTIRSRARYPPPRLFPKADPCSELLGRETLQYLFGSIALISPQREGCVEDTTYFRKGMGKEVLQARYRYVGQSIKWQHIRQPVIVNSLK